MKKRLIASPLLLAALLLSACASSEDISPYLGLDTSKGIELYCYQDGEGWKMGLMTGTDRLKTQEEVDSLNGISLDGMKRVLSTYDGYADYLSIIAVSRPSRIQELMDLTHIDNLDGLNKIEGELGFPLTTDVGLYSMVDWVGEIYEKEISYADRQTDLGTISPTFSARESTYRISNETSLKAFASSLYSATISAEVSDPLYGGSGYIYSLAYEDDTYDYLQVSNGYVITDNNEYHKLTSSFSFVDSELYSENFVMSTYYGGTLYKDGVKLDLDTTFISRMEFLEEVEQAKDPAYEGYSLYINDEEYLTFYDSDSFAINGVGDTTFHRVINDVSFPFPD